MYRKRMSEALEEARSYRDPVNEDKGFSSQQIKMAYGVLNDPRYKQGNYSGAFNAIEKIAKGLASHPDVANALKRANEELEEETIKEYKKMTVTFRDMATMSKASTDLAKYGFTIDAKGLVMKVDGKGADLNAIGTDIQNFYGATVVAENLEEKKADFLRLKFANNQTVKKAERWLYNNMGHSNPGYMSMIADKGSIEFQHMNDADSVMTKLKRAGFSFKVDMRENLEERFTKKDFDKNEDENDHSLNAIMLAKEFGTSQEIKDMEDIDKRHKQRGHINDPDYSKRNALVRKYYPRLK